MDPKRTLVSIIMPAYDAGPFIHSAIHSVLSQTHENWELIIIDNGSTDNTNEVISSFSDKRIHPLYLDKNMGVSTARNIGLSKMRGDFFCFLDADDFFPQLSLESRLQIFSENKDIYFVDGSVDYYDKTLAKKLRTWSPDFEGNPLHDLLCLTGKSFLGNTWMIRRNKNKDYIFDEELTHSEDLMFCINLALEGGDYNFTTNTILKYRTGHNSAMKNLKGLEAGYRRVYLEILKNPQIPKEWKSDFYKKSLSIMFKSYLGNFNFFSAIRLLAESW